MSDAWAQALKEIAALFRSLWEKGGAAIAAFFAGRASKEREQEKADADAIEQTLEDEREINRRRNDPDERDRVLQDYTRPKPSDDPQ